jgi:hypothetical protein
MLSSKKSQARSKTAGKRSRSVDRVTSSSTIADSTPTPAPVSSKSTSPSAHTTQLSGATRNMRFMQRGMSATTVNHKVMSRHSFPRHSFPQHSTSTGTMSTNSEPTKEATINSNSDVSGSSNRSDHPTSTGTHQSMEVNCERIVSCEATHTTTIKWETASPIDIYGHHECLLIGRRSYNGFNTVTASNFYMQQQHVEYEEIVKRRSKDKTNKNLEQRSSRYEELSEQVRDEDNESSILSRGQKSGSKKKSTNSISNQKKKHLDDILKLVDS